MLIMRLGDKALLAVLILSATEAASADPMSFSVESLPGGGFLVWASGTIEPDTAEIFQDLAELNGFGTGTIVAFDSKGGSVAGALAVGQVIRKGNMSTEVSAKISSVDDPATCASACVYAFAGGIERTKSPDSNIGVHQFFSATLTTEGLSEAQFAIAGLSEFLRTGGISQELLEAASSTGPDAIRWLRDSELHDWNLLTRAGNFSSPVWQLSGSGLFMSTDAVQPSGHILSATVSCPSWVKDADYEKRNYGPYSKPSSPERAPYQSATGLYENYNLGVSLPKVATPLPLEDKLSITKVSGATLSAEKYGSDRNYIESLSSGVSVFDMTVGLRRRPALVSLNSAIHETLIPEIIGASQGATALLLQPSEPVFGFQKIHLPAESFAENLEALQIHCDLRRTLRPF